MFFILSSALYSGILLFSQSPVPRSCLDSELLKEEFLLSVKWTYRVIGLVQMGGTWDLPRSAAPISVMLVLDSC